MNTTLNFLPISINIRNRRILIVGGGKVAAHKAAILSRFTNNATVLAPQIDDKFREIPFQIRKKKYEPDDLKDYQLVYICTDNHELNRQIKEDAQQKGIVASVCDAPDLCDFVSPAICSFNHITIAVGSDARDVKKSIAIRNRIQELIEDGTLRID